MTEVDWNHQNVTPSRTQLPTMIAERRRWLGLSQSAAARLAGVSRNGWIKWESGVATPLDSNYASLERALDWKPGSVEAILAGHVSQPVRHEHSPPNRLPIDEETLKRYEPADRELILAVLRAAEARATRRHSKEVNEQREDPKGA